MSGSDARRFDVAESSSLRVLWVALPVLVVFGLSVHAQLTTSRTDAPWMEITLSPPFFLMGGSAAWSLFVLALIGVGLAWAFFRRRIALDGDVLVVHSTLYRRRTPVAQMRLDAAEVVDLKRDRRYALGVKTNGYSMPGFHSGHYRLREGGKAFALVTDVHQVLAIPVTGQATLLLSVAAPQQLLEALRAVAARAPRR